MPFICMCWFPNETQFLHFWSMGKVTEHAVNIFVFHFHLVGWTEFYLFIKLNFPPYARWYPDIIFFLVMGRNKKKCATIAGVVLWFYEFVCAGREYHFATSVWKEKSAREFTEEWLFFFSFTRSQWDLSVIYSAHVCTPECKACVISFNISYIHTVC